MLILFIVVKIQCVLNYSYFSNEKICPLILLKEQISSYPLIVSKLYVKSWEIFIRTSLKIFKHYKLKPSFSIIKDEKAKNKVRVGNKPPPPSFNNLIKFDPIWSSLIQFDQVWSNLIRFDPIWSILIQFIPIWSHLINLIKFDPFYSTQGMR